MSNKRIEYLDALKGFAIFLMVVGHVIPWNMPEYKLQNISEYPCHIKEVGRFLVAQGYVTCLTLQILYSTVVAIFAIICSICLAKFIRRSKLIGRLLFGS